MWRNISASLNTGFRRPSEDSSYLCDLDRFEARTSESRQIRYLLNRNQTVAEMENDMEFHRE